MTECYIELKQRLARSAFRSRFHLDTAGKRYALEKGFEQICGQAKQILRTRLGSAHPVNDGKQTPMHGHVVFIAQHATGSCCRGCLEKWFYIPRFSPLTEDEIATVADVITQWIFEQCEQTENILYTPDLAF